MSITAYAASIRSVRVYLSAAPLEKSNTTTGSVYNPASWILTRLDNSFIFNILSIEKIATNDYEIFTLEYFGAANVSHRLDTNGLLDAGGAAFPGSVTVSGVAQPLSSSLRGRSYAQNDLACPPFRVANSVGGSFVIGADGDYSLEGGQDLYKKLVYRRLYCKPGDFFHLPNYGLGVRIKERIPTNDLVKFKAEVERQVKLEPETASVIANPYMMSDDVLVVALKATMKTSGATVDVAMNATQGGIL